MASGYLARLEGGASGVVYVARNRRFRLPPDSNRPVVMVGAGTGVAPFRAFLQEREAAGAAGPAWLFFGDRRFRTDFLYQTEWQRWLRTGVLSRIDLAFSRDAGERVYVQDRMRRQARDLYRWLEDGAVLYVCGDAGGMAAGVDAALRDVVRQEVGQTAEAADAYVAALARDRRYLRDVY